MFEKFYNETIRRTVIGFGSLFDDIYIKRKNKDGTVAKEILVPITYSAKEKFLRMLREYPLLKGASTNSHIGNILPRMGFSITSIDYDGSRKRNTIIKRAVDSSVDSSSGLVLENKTEFSEVPYNIGFQLNGAARTTDDALQIVEQILPYFTPEFTISVNYTSELNTNIDVPIILNSVTPEIEYEGDTADERTVIFNMSFTALTYLFSPTKTNKNTSY